MAVASPPNTEFHFRTANLDDADDLAAIACAAFPSEPEWDYRFPHSKEFPSDTFHYHKEFYETLLKREINVIRVVTRAVENEEGEEKGKVIAFAIWEMQYKSSAFVGPLAEIPAPNNPRGAANPQRMAAFANECMLARKHNFVNVYGTQYLHLRTLATHPDWQRKGAGRRLCEWGLQVAREDGVPVTVLTTPIGEKLYEALGFQMKGRFWVQVHGEKERICKGIMVKVCGVEDQRN